MPPTIELSGVSIVGAGSFNPAIFQPRWLAAKELVPDGLAEHAETQLVVTPQLTAFTSDWLSLQVTDEQAVFSTVHEGREVDLRDFARGVLEVLPETPVDALGINADAHFKVESEDAWHALGDQWLPKSFGSHSSKATNGSGVRMGTPWDSGR
jgi:hypothetical protein